MSAPLLVRGPLSRWDRWNMRSGANMFVAHMLVRTHSPNTNWRSQQGLPLSVFFFFSFWLHSFFSHLLSPHTLESENNPSESWRQASASKKDVSVSMNGLSVIKSQLTSHVLFKHSRYTRKCIWNLPTHHSLCKHLDVFYSLVNTYCSRVTKEVFSTILCVFQCKYTI